MIGIRLLLRRVEREKSSRSMTWRRSKFSLNFSLILYDKNPFSFRVRQFTSDNLRLKKKVENLETENRYVQVNLFVKRSIFLGALWGGRIMHFLSHKTIKF